MNELVNKLEKLNFTKIEAQIYIALLQYRQLNGSQISKIINVSRSTVYNTLNNLYNKGAVLLLPGETKIYKPENPKTLIDKITQKYIESASSIKEDLASINVENTDDQYWNIKGYENFIFKVKEYLLSAEKEIYINTNYRLDIFEKELTILKEKGVRILSFSFKEHEIEKYNIEHYALYNIPESDKYPNKRMMLVIDNKKVLLASGVSNDNFTGIFTENSLLVRVIAEHIHHDIYFAKLKEKYNKDLIDKDIIVNSILENEEN